ncbi:MAG TPA: nucleotidyltransferase family protein [Anaerolineae bacterium]
MDTAYDMSAVAFEIPEEEIRRLCHQWQIVELALFGSVLRDDFGPDSDVDVLVTFAPDANWGLLEHVQMEQELEDLLQREVDLISKRAVERSHNWIRRQEILDTAQVLFSAQ